MSIKTTENRTIYKRWWNDMDKNLWCELNFTTGEHVQSNHKHEVKKLTWYMRYCTQTKKNNWWTTGLSMSSRKNKNKITVILFFLCFVPRSWGYFDPSDDVVVGFDDRPLNLKKLKGFDSVRLLVAVDAAIDAFGEIEQDDAPSIDEDSDEFCCCCCCWGDEEKRDTFVTALGEVSFIADAAVVNRLLVLLLLWSFDDVDKKDDDCLIELIFCTWSSFGGVDVCG